MSLPALMAMKRNVQHGIHRLLKLRLLLRQGGHDLDTLRNVAPALLQLAHMALSACECGVHVHTHLPNQPRTHCHQPHAAHDGNVGASLWCVLCVVARQRPPMHTPRATMPSTKPSSSACGSCGASRLHGLITPVCTNLLTHDAAHVCTAFQVGNAIGYWLALMGQHFHVLAKGCVCPPVGLCLSSTSFVTQQHLNEFTSEQCSSSSMVCNRNTSAAREDTVDRSAITSSTALLLIADDSVLPRYLHL